MVEKFSENQLKVGLGERSYPIYFGDGNLQELGECCRNARLGNNAVVVTNPLVAEFYFEMVKQSLESSGFTVFLIQIPDGEEHKSLATLESVYDRLIDFGVDRGAFIVALGGGVVGDLAGYAAATFLRGIPFVQVPTTLLAQVDSSVGGKTGVNHTRGKNLIGAFYQPVLVLIDIATLRTLAEREFLSGLAEVVKYGAVLDGNFFKWLEENIQGILRRTPESLLAVTKRCCELKAAVVERDEREAGLRAVLNYGHTIGHAVENLSGYGSYRHGEAVAIGIAQAAKISLQYGMSTDRDLHRITVLLKELGLPVDLPAFSLSDFSEAILHDKKVKEGGVNFVLNKGIGDFHFQRITDIPALLNGCRIGG